MLKAALALLAALPALLTRLFEVIGAVQRRAERDTLKAEAEAAAAVSAEQQSIEQERETRNAMDKAGAALPDRAAAVERLRRGEF